MTFKELVTEVIARGFEHVSNQSGGEDRIKRWVNQAYREIVDARAWPFLETTKEGTAPLEVADLGHVLSVVNSSDEGKLDYVERAVLLDYDPTLSATGTANLWYLEDGDTIKVHPADAGSTFLVRYLKNPAALKEDADEPVVPVAYQDLIVDGAVVRAYKNTDNFEAAGFVRQEFDRGLRGMAKTLRPNYDSPRVIARTGTVNDYI